MIPRWPIASIPLLLALADAACRSLPAQPGAEAIRPDQVTDFDVLYRQNCSGCHGATGWGGAANPLADPVYLAVIDDVTLRQVTAQGVPNSLMPAFARSAGGMLTDPQIDAIVQGIRQHWAKPGVLAGAAPPPYAAPRTGDPQRGAQVYATFCASCHGPEGKGGAKASSIVDDSYLGIVSNQQLRTAVICGRPDFGAPDWRHDVSGRAMTDEEISDVVAWLASQRPQFPGQPYPGPTAGGTP
jgi:cytochrome c oxidase cbb3-type subunit III